MKQVFNDSQLPFEDNTFDIIINRHESFDINEVMRILKTNGIFITQQVGGKNNEYFPYLRFKDIGAIVYFAKIIEWEFPMGG